MLCLLAMRFLPHTGDGMDSGRQHLRYQRCYQQGRVPR